MERNREIIRTSIVGVAVNVLLAAFKAVVGLLAGSIAIVMDAVNNLSDVLSSVITIIGTKLSERPADRMHPFGYGRVEYFSAIVISAIVLTAGITSLFESAKKIFNPTLPEYTASTLVVIIVAIAAKLLLGRYVKAKGEKLRSDSLVASGSDALFDAAITLSTLVSAVIMLVWDVSVDGYLGTLISLMIIRSGIRMLKSPIDELLGTRVSDDLVRQIIEDVMGFEGVEGVHDIILHTYGPNTTIGSLHVSVPETTTASQIHHLDRSIAGCLHKKYGIIATVGVYADNTGVPPAARMQKDIMRRAVSMEGIIGAHAFYADFDKKVISLDIVPDFDVQDGETIKEALIASLEKDYPGFTFDIVVDYNYSGA